MIGEFEVLFKKWVSDACEEWGYPFPKEDYFQHQVRFGDDIQQDIVKAISEKVVIPDKFFFYILDDRGVKRRYKWFSENRQPKPCPNWEYFVQVAKYCNYREIAHRNGLLIFFEFFAMDLCFYDHKSNRIVLICEVKQSADDVEELLKGMAGFEREIDYSKPDNSDSFRKANYIQLWKPKFFRVVSADGKRDFEVHYPSGYVFQLKEVIDLKDFQR